MKKLLYLSALSALFVLSCKKDKTNDADPITQVTTASYTKYMYPLAIGNYWVYGEISIDSLGNQTAGTLTDSVYIDKDTVINGVTYYRLLYKDVYNPGGTYSYYRDSSGYRVSLNGIVLPIPGNPGDTLSTYVDPMNLYTNYTLVATPPAAITLPSGTFNDLFLVRNDYYLNAPFNADFNPVANNRYSSASVGLLSYQFTFSSTPWVTYERRLIRYHLN